MLSWDLTYPPKTLQFLFNQVWNITVELGSFAENIVWLQLALRVVYVYIRGGISYFRVKRKGLILFAIVKHWRLTVWPWSKFHPSVPRKMHGMRAHFTMVVIKWPGHFKGKGLAFTGSLRKSRWKVLDWLEDSYMHASSQSNSLYKPP
jgi:hypothetical protein